MSGFVTGKVDDNLTRVLLTQEAPHPRQWEKRRTVPLEYRASASDHNHGRIARTGRCDNGSKSNSVLCCNAISDFSMYMTGDARVAVSPLHLKCSFFRKHEGSSPNRNFIAI
jgi:hypothetical protein